jgi:hypothetical protein
MKLSVMLFMFISFMLNAFALDIVLMDYSDIDHDEIKAYNYSQEGCECICNGY